MRAMKHYRTILESPLNQVSWEAWDGGMVDSEKRGLELERANTNRQLPVGHYLFQVI